MQQRMKTGTITVLGLLLALSVTIPVAAAEKNPPMLLDTQRAAKKDVKKEAVQKKASDAKKTTSQKTKASERLKKTSTPAEKNPPALALPEGLDPETRKTLVEMSEALNLEARAIYHELRDDEELAAKDIGMLWQAAVERSGAIRYAIEKLSRRDATGEPVENDGLAKRLLQNVTRLGGVASSMWTGTPAGLIGSNMLEDMLFADGTDMSKMRVTDADMVILAKEVEALQTQVIERYYDFRHARERWNLAQEAHRVLQIRAEESPIEPVFQPIVTSLQDAAYQEELQTRQAYLKARNALAMLVGPDALAVLENAPPEKAAR